jgi:hypothetical protein
MDGRLYFREKLAQELGRDLDPAEITPDKIRALPPIQNLQRLPGGTPLASDSETMPSTGLIRLTPEETALRALRSEAFLRMPPKVFAAEEV